MPGKSITIHALDDVLGRLIEERAQSEGLSLNKTIKKLLAEALGVKPPAQAPHTQDFEEFLGVWTDEEAAAFHERIRDLERVDEEDWA